jgi:streptogramin lyase
VAAVARTGPVGQTVCPAPRSFSSLPLFARVRKADDVMVDSNGNVWVSNVGGHEVTELSPAGTVLHVFADGQNPEGMVQLSSSTVALANQKSNQVVVFDTTTGQSKLWVQLTSKGLGVDGLGMEPGMLLLPDSAGGNLDTVPLPPFSGGPVTVATGLGRPVDATPVGDGTLLVTVENPPGLDRVNPVTGTVTPAASFASTDDVVVSNGIAYVADNGGGTMSAVTLSSGMVNTLVTGVKAAQGLAMRADGTFLVVDEKSGDIRVAMGC